jgi:hypothetical protein
VIQGINDQFPTELNVSFPEPYDVLYTGSKGGYTAAVEANLVEQYTDRQFNGMQPEEATFLPGMRLVMYNDGRYGINREVLDFVGVQVDSALAVHYLGPPQLEVKARAIPTIIPGTGDDGAEPGTPGILGTPVRIVHHLLRSLHGGHGAAGLPGVKVIEDLFRGFGLAWRSLGQLLQMFSFVLVLALPLVLMARRQSWLSDRITG